MGNVRQPAPKTSILHFSFSLISHPFPISNARPHSGLVLCSVHLQAATSLVYATLTGQTGALVLWMRKTGSWKWNQSVAEPVCFKNWVATEICSWQPNAWSPDTTFFNHPFAENTRKHSCSTCKTSKGTGFPKCTSRLFCWRV